MRYETIILYDDTSDGGSDLTLNKVIFENDDVILGEFENDYYKDDKKLICMICKKTNTVSNSELDFYLPKFVLGRYDAIALYVENNKQNYDLTKEEEINKFKIAIEIEAKTLDFDLTLFNVIFENRRIILFYNDDLEFAEISIDKNHNLYIDKNAEWININNYEPQYYECVFARLKTGEIVEVWRASEGEYNIWTKFGTEQVYFDEDIIEWIPFKKKKNV